MNQIKFEKIKSFIPGVFLITGIISGCSTASTDPVRVEADFGNSLKNMVDAQIIDHDAARALYAKPVIGMDGSSAQKVLHEHRTMESNADAVSEEIDLEIDN